MNTRQKIMGLAALPLAGLLATGGVALAQANGSPAGTRIVQQATVTQRDGAPSPVHAARTATPATAQQSQVRDQVRARDGSCDHQAATTATAQQSQVRDRDRARDGSCDHQAATTATANQTANQTRDRARDGSCDK